MLFCNLIVINYGDGKAGFGDSGLSANLKEMHRGVNKNLKFAYENQLITLKQYILARMWESIKYVRRIVIVRMKNDFNVWDFWCFENIIVSY